RNPSMFLRRGHAYVYISYGVWPMLNISSEEVGVGEAVLVRALEPLEGIELMRRGNSERVLDIARGPGRLARAMEVTLLDDAADITPDGKDKAVDACQAMNQYGPVKVQAAVEEGLGDWLIWVKDKDDDIWMCNANSHGAVFTNIMMQGDLLKGDGNALINLHN